MGDGTDVQDVCYSYRNFCWEGRHVKAGEDFVHFVRGIFIFRFLREARDDWACEGEFWALQEHGCVLNVSQSCTRIIGYFDFLTGLCMRFFN